MKLWETVQSALEAREPFEVTYRIATARGEERLLWERGSGIYDVEVEAREGFITDVSERVTLESERLELAERLQSVVESSPEPVVALDDEGLVSVWNEAAVETFGWSAEEVVGEPYPAVPREERAQHEEMVERVEAGEPASDGEIVRRTKEGERLTLSISSGQIRDTDGESSARWG